LLTKIIKWSAIAALIGGGFEYSIYSYRLLSQFVVVAAAAVVLTQAARMRQYVWMTLFLLVVCLFNPVVPVPFSSYIFGVVSILSVLLFFFSLELLRPKRKLSIASITDRMPGSESL
jgi:flagellar biosynthesis protein FlhB